ncbi:MULTISPECIES: DUF1816 domain-containing protein [Spirulina sp. CCY15215]|uniref:DUF1816 domain-containing protein n=1 Tax=Spirulina sp. CCY15215 TaxID=2767591 RepID=UPI001950F8C2|nr:DUF1816 domain-containing protein [Spirulina major]
MKNVLIRFLEASGFAYWVEVKTDSPRCTYYFGPFLSDREAQETAPGYIEDLKEEGARGISVKIERMRPKELTVFEEELGEKRDREIIPSLSGRLSSFS